jgi:undecaprenyl pyrophosphate phosphatase UppP
MAGLSAAGGIGSFFALLIMAQGWPHHMAPAFHLAFGYFIATIPIAVVGLMVRKWFTRLPETYQRVSASIVICVSALMLIVLTVAIGRN